MNDPDKRILRPFKYWRRLERYTNLPRDLAALRTDGALDEALVTEMMRGYEHTFDGIDFSATNTFFPGGETAFLKTITDGVEQDYRSEVAELIPIMCNLAAVMACTIFDTYLVDTFETLLVKDPELINLVVLPETRNGESKVDRRSEAQDEVAPTAKALRRFDFAGIEEKFRILARVGVDIDWVFGQDGILESARQEQAKSREHLLSLYKRRNDIVHRHQLPFRTPREIGAVDILLHRTMFRIARVIYGMWHIPMDFFMFMTDMADPRLRER